MPWIPFVLLPIFGCSFIIITLICFVFAYSVCAPSTSCLCLVFKFHCYSSCFIIYKNIIIIILYKSIFIIIIIMIIMGCHCGVQVDELATIGRRCRWSESRLPHHTAVNGIICQSLTLAKVPAKLESSGLHRSDGKRPDGILLLPWKDGNFW